MLGRAKRSSLRGAFGVDDRRVASSGKTTTRENSQNGFRNMAPAAGGFDGRVSSRGSRTTGASGESGWDGAVAGTGTDKPLEIVKARSRKRTVRERRGAGGHRGRLHIDDDLMNELSMLKKECSPAKCFSSRIR